MRRLLPPILILMPDQMRADCMSAVGHPLIRTPNLDRLASEGTLFSHACTSSPLCMPARASFISGLFAHSHHIWNNSGQLPHDDESVFQHLQRAGYHTCHIGKSHYYPHGRFHLRDREPYMQARGFNDVHETTGPWATVTTDSYMTDAWDQKGLLQPFREDYQKRRQFGPCAVWPSPLSVEEFLDSYVGRRAVEWSETYTGNKPPCLFVGFGGPHEPWDAPGEYATMYAPEDTPPPIPPEELPDWLPDHVRTRILSRRVQGMPGAHIGRIRASYYGKITLIDHWIGEIIAAWQRRGWWEDAVVLFWSDHGEMAGDFGWLHKSNFHESALRVPWIIRWPGVAQPGAVSTTLVSTVDAFPTLLDIVGCEASPRAQGRSIAPVLRGETTEVRDTIFSEVGNMTMLRDQRHKYVIDSQGRGFMLYDLEKDPHEQCNLIGHPDYVGLEAEMRDRLLCWLVGTQVVL
ncbi:MAG: sulfatase family protein [Candidatus Zipacnadales bacterium]